MAALARRRAAFIAQALSLGVTTSLLAVAAVPEHWRFADKSLAATASTRGGMLALWHGLGRVLPIADLWSRLDLLTVPLLLLLAVVTTRAAYLLFRGPGRVPAAIVAGPIAALATAGWAREVGAGEALDAIAAAIFATLAISAVVRSHVHVGAMAPIAAARAAAATMTVLLFSPRTVAILLPVVGGAVLLGTRRNPAAGRQSLRAMVIAGSVPLLAAVTLAILSPSYEAFAPLSLHARAGWPSSFAPTMPAVLVHAALVLAILSTFVLRWRGAAVLATWIGAAAWIADAHGPLVTPPVLIATLAIAASGWAWVTASGLRRHPVLATTLASAAAVVLFSLGPGKDVHVPSAVASQRPVHAFADLVARGMVGPRDVFVVHDPKLREHFSERAAVEGWRPDVILFDARDLPDEKLALATLYWRDEGRRVVSDSWNMGGRWPASWAIDSGPLFWFVGPRESSDHEFTDLASLYPDLGELAPEEALPWIRLAVERARFRRALQMPDAALAALPLTVARHRGLLTRLQLARSDKPEPGAGSELVRASDRGPSGAHGWIAAEAGDLLFSHGEQQRATELLAEAANAGWIPAWGALARWQLRAGLDDAAQQTLRAMGSDPMLRDEALAIVWWMLRRDRIDDARALLQMLRAHDPISAPTSEIATRLSLLRAAVPVPAAIPPPDDGPAIGRAP